MTFRKNLRTALISLGALLLATQAHAIAVSDATILNSTGGLDDSSATAMGSGKIKNANINGLTGLFAGDDWSLLDRTHKSSKTFNDVNFLLTADTGQRAGEWFLDWTGSDVPDYMDYVVVFKSGKQWGAYLFESVDLSLDLEDLGGAFQISWLNKKGKIAKLRHASIFGRVAEAPVIPPDGPGDPGDPENPGNPGDPGNPGEPDANDVPSPGSLALLAMGLGLMLMRLRQMELHTARIPNRPN